MNEFISEELLSAYLDGELSGEEQTQVEEALAQSPRLRQLLAELRSLGGSLEMLPTHRVKEDLAASVLRRAEREMLAGGAAGTNGHDAKATAKDTISSAIAPGNSAGPALVSAPTVTPAVTPLPATKRNDAAMWRMRVWAVSAIAACVVLMLSMPLKDRFTGMAIEKTDAVKHNSLKDGDAKDSAEHGKAMLDEKRFDNHFGQQEFNDGEKARAVIANGANDDRAGGNPNLKFSKQAETTDLEKSPQKRSESLPTEGSRETGRKMEVRGRDLVKDASDALVAPLAASPGATESKTAFGVKLGSAADQGGQEKAIDPAGGFNQGSVAGGGATGRVAPGGGSLQGNLQAKDSVVPAYDAPTPKLANGSPPASDPARSFKTEVPRTDAVPSTTGSANAALTQSAAMFKTYQVPVTVVQVEVPRSAVEKGQLETFFSQQNIQLAETSYRAAIAGRQRYAIAPTSTGVENQAVVDRHVNGDEKIAPAKLPAASGPNTARTKAGGDKSQAIEEHPVGDGRRGADEPRDEGSDEKKVADQQIARQPKSDGRVGEDQLQELSAAPGEQSLSYELVGVEVSQERLQAMLGDLKKQSQWQMALGSAPTTYERVTTLSDHETDPSETLLAWSEIATEQAAGAKVADPKSATAVVVDPAAIKLNVGDDNAKGGSVKGDNVKIESAKIEGGKDVKDAKSSPQPEADDKAKTQSTAAAGLPAAPAQTHDAFKESASPKAISKSIDRSIDKAADKKEDHTADQRVKAAERATEKLAAGGIEPREPEKTVAKKSDVADKPAEQLLPYGRNEAPAASTLGANLDEQPKPVVITNRDHLAIAQRGLRRSVAANDGAALKQIDDLLQRTSEQAESKTLDKMQAKDAAPQTTIQFAPTPVAPMPLAPASPAPTVPAPPPPAPESPAPAPPAINLSVQPLKAENGNRSTESIKTGNVAKRPSADKPSDPAKPADATKQSDDSKLADKVKVAAPAAPMNRPVLGKPAPANTPKPPAPVDNAKSAPADSSKPAPGGYGGGGLGAGNAAAGSAAAGSAAAGKGISGGGAGGKDLPGITGGGNGGGGAARMPAGEGGPPSFGMGSPGSAKADGVKAESANLGGAKAGAAAPASGDYAFPYKAEPKPTGAVAGGSDAKPGAMSAPAAVPQTAGLAPIAEPDAAAPVALEREHSLKLMEPIPNRRVLFVFRIVPDATTATAGSPPAASKAAPAQAPPVEIQRDGK